MVRLRWKWGLTLFVLLGALAALIMSSSRYDLITCLIILGMPAVLLLPGVLRMVAGSARELLGGFTWWEGLWLLLFASGLVFRDRGIQEIEGEALDRWALFRIGLVGLAGTILLIRAGLGRSNWPRYLFRGLVVWLTAFASVCVLSSFWSVFPSWTLYKSCEYFVDVAALAAVVASAKSIESYKRLFDWTWTLTGLLLVSVWMGLALWPKDALIPIWRAQRMIAGIFSFQIAGVIPQLNSNTVGELGALIGVIAVARLLRGEKRAEDRVWYGLLLALALLTMCFAQARSGILGFVVGAGLVLIVSRRVSVGLVVFTGVALVLIVNGSTWGVVSDFLRRGESDEELYSLSSRVDWWSLAWPKILDHPFTGYGAFAGARFFVLSQSGLDVASIHSDWVETVVGTGLWGLVPAMIVLAGTWRALTKSVRRSAATFLEGRLRMEAIGALAVVSIRSIFSNDLFWHPPLVFFAVLAYVQFLVMQRKGKSAVRPSLQAVG